MKYFGVDACVALSVAAFVTLTEADGGFHFTPLTDGVRIRPPARFHVRPNRTSRIAEALTP